MAVLKETGLSLWCCLSGNFSHNYDHTPSLESFKFEIVLVLQVYTKPFHVPERYKWLIERSKYDCSICQWHDDFI